MSNEKTEYLNLDLLHPFENNPFQSVDEKEYDELIDRIEVHETEGTGKNKTQRIVIHYRFVGNIDIPSEEENLKLDMRQGMAVEYLTA